MKKTLTLICLASIMCSCEKPANYKCVCTTTSKNILSSGTTTERKSYNIYDKKRKAEKRCKEYEPDGIEIWGSTSCTLF